MQISVAPRALRAFVTRNEQTEFCEELVAFLAARAERMEGFAGEEWLRKGEDGKPAFVARLIENKKCLDKAQVMSHEKVKKSVEGLELEV